MKRLLPFFAALIVSSLACGADPKQPGILEAAGYPALKIDDAHAQTTNGTVGAQYELAPATGVILDCAGYQFHIPPELKVDHPNAVQVLIGPRREYSADWKPQIGKLLLDASTLRPMNQSQPFTGFQSGDFVTLAVGQPNEGGRPKFVVIWLGMVHVK